MLWSLAVPTLGVRKPTGHKMRQAKNIEELLIIRQAMIPYLESINFRPGTAFGLKNADGAPCVTVLVPKKINKKWLPAGTLIHNSSRPHPPVQDP